MPQPSNASIWLWDKQREPNTHILHAVQTEVLSKAPFSMSLPPLAREIVQLLNR